LSSTAVSSGYSFTRECRPLSASAHLLLEHELEKGDIRWHEVLGLAPAASAEPALGQWCSPFDTNTRPPKLMDFDRFHQPGSCRACVSELWRGGRSFAQILMSGMFWGGVLPFVGNRSAACRSSRPRSAQRKRRSATGRCGRQGPSRSMLGALPE